MHDKPRWLVDCLKGMYKECVVSILKSLSEAIPSFDIHYSTFCGSAVRFLTS